MFSNTDQFFKWLDQKEANERGLSKAVRRHLCRFACMTFLPDRIKRSSGSISDKCFLLKDVDDYLKNPLEGAGDCRGELKTWYRFCIIRRVPGRPGVLQFWTSELRDKLAAEYAINPDADIRDSIRNLYKDHGEWRLLLVALLKHSVTDPSQCIKETFFPAVTNKLDDVDELEKRIEDVKSRLGSETQLYDAALERLSRVHDGWRAESDKKIQELSQLSFDAITKSDEYSDAIIFKKHIRLLALALKYFDEDELEALCFDASIDYEDIRRNTVPQFRRELSKFAARRGKTQFSIVVTLVLKERSFIREDPQFETLLPYESR